MQSEQEADHHDNNIQAAQKTDNVNHI